LSTSEDEGPQNVQPITIKKLKTAKRKAAPKINEKFLKRNPEVNKKDIKNVRDQEKSAAARVDNKPPADNYAASRRKRMFREHFDVNLFTSAPQNIKPKRIRLNNNISMECHLLDLGDKKIIIIPTIQL